MGKYRKRQTSQIYAYKDTRKEETDGGKDRRRKRQTEEKTDGGKDRRRKRQTEDMTDGG
jgi:hypothetical protein